MTILHDYHPERDMDAIAAFDARMDKREARKLARLTAEGYTHCTCDSCGDVRTLAWVDGECNNYDGTTEDEMCSGVYRAARGGAA